MSKDTNGGAYIRVGKAHEVVPKEIKTFQTVARGPKVVQGEGKPGPSCWDLKEVRLWIKQRFGGTNVPGGRKAQRGACVLFKKQEQGECREAGSSGRGPATAGSSSALGTNAEQHLLDDICSWVGPCPRGRFQQGTH